MSNLVAPCVLRWSTFILNDPSYSIRKLVARAGSTLRYKRHVDFQILIIKLTPAFVTRAFGLYEKYMCVLSTFISEQHYIKS